MHGDKLVGMNRLSTRADTTHNYHALPKGTSTRVVLCNCMPTIKLGKVIKHCFLPFGKKRTERNKHKLYKHTDMMKALRQQMDINLNCSVDI